MSEKLFSQLSGRRQGYSQLYLLCILSLQGQDFFALVVEEYIYDVLILFENSSALTVKEDSCLLYKMILYLMSSPVGLFENSKCLCDLSVVVSYILSSSHFDVLISKTN